MVDAGIFIWFIRRFNIHSKIEASTVFTYYCLSNHRWLFRTNPIYPQNVFKWFLSSFSDINQCLSKCCTNGGCDLAYLVNRDQCFSVKCFTPELCQMTDKLFHNRDIEIAKLIKPKRSHHISRGM